MKYLCIYICLFFILFVVGTATSQNLLIPLLRDSTHRQYRNFQGDLYAQNRSYHWYNAANLPLRDLIVDEFDHIPAYYDYNYEYNAKKLRTRTTTYRSDDSFAGPWVNWSQEEITYDNHDRPIEHVGKKGLGNNWENAYRKIIGFDDTVPADSSLAQVWDAGINNWINSKQIVNKYSPTGNLKQHVEEAWDFNVDDWRTELYKVYTYYPDGKLRASWSIFFDFSSISSIVTDSFLYLPNGHIDSTFSSYQSSGSGAVNHFVEDWEYDGDNHLIRRNSWVVLPGGWHPSVRRTFQPGDGHYSNDFSEELEEYYNSQTQTFEVNSKRSREFFDLSDGRILYREEKYARAADGSLRMIFLDSVWYHQLAMATDDTGDLTAPLCSFPNPLSSGQHITCSASDINSVMVLRMVSMTGQLVDQQQVMPGESWAPAGNYPPGVYLLTIQQNGRFLGEKKILIMP